MVFVKLDGVEEARRVVVIADRRVGLDVVDGSFVFVVESETTPKRRRNCEGFVRVEVSVVRVVGLGVVVENLVRSRVNFRLAIAVSETDRGVVAVNERPVVAETGGPRVVVGRPRFLGTNEGKPIVVVDSAGV